MIWFTIIDWSEQITNESLVRLIRARFPMYWESLDVGSIASANTKRTYRTAIERHMSDVSAWQKAEWFGGVASKSDPEKKWESYFSICAEGQRELTICSSSKDMSMEKLLLFIEEASRLGNLGYGYGDDWDAPGLSYYIAGITYGLPMSAEEKQKADRLARWFRERIPSHNLSPRRRYLSGMYRGAFRINVLNQSHVVYNSDGNVHLAQIKDAKGELMSYQNGTFVWSIPKSDVTYSDQSLAALGLQI